MDYPLITEYVEAIKAAEDNLEQLKNLRPVLGMMVPSYDQRQFCRGVQDEG